MSWIWCYEEKTKKEDVEEITKIQFEILNSGAKYLKIGGNIVYSTCSILKSENEDIIEKWLQYINMEKNQNNKKYIVEKKEKILPSKDTDGFFICKIKRIS